MTDPDFALSIAVIVEISILSAAGFYFMARERRAAAGRSKRRHPAR